MPNLRVLHLRQRNYLREDDLMFQRDGDTNSDACTFQTQRWANAFFEYLHARGWCPNLTALVIRCYVLDNKQEDDEGVHYYVPECCYVKGFQTDRFGRSGVVAVPVTRATLRASEPHSDILDFDPE
jgi:hypothetical protein